MPEAFPVGWFCLLPPLLTIILAIVSKRVVYSLFLGIVSAILILNWFGADSSGSDSWLTGLIAFFKSLTIEHLWASLVDADHLQVFAFTTLLGMQVALIHRTGGMLGIVRWASPLAKTRRGGQILTWLLGLVIFIDDYANTLLLGSTMRPITDRLKISREKLAFLVDSTAAPVSGLALVSTWVATEISYMQAGYEDANIQIGSQTFGIFIQTIPLRFYILYALAFVFLCGLLCRDFGPMLRAESKAQESEPTDASSGAVHSLQPQAINAIVPIVLTVAVVVWLLVRTGQSELNSPALPPLSDWQAWCNVVGNGDSYLALVYGASAGLLAILVLSQLQKRLSLREVGYAMLEGFKHVLPALVILWLAWTLSKLTGAEYLQTGNFLASQIGKFEVAAGLMPTIVFLLASAVAFSTGTSWGTMAILMPIVIPLVYSMLSGELGSLPDADHFVLTATIGSVLAGAIFGDHCSPISDTTILSSRSSHCDHIAHVNTQMPYAITIGTVSILAGTLPAGFGVASWILLPIGLILLTTVLLVIGRPVSVSVDSD